MPKRQRTPASPLPSQLTCLWKSEADDYVIDALFREDGSSVAVAASSGPIDVFNTATGERRSRLAGHRLTTTSLTSLVGTPWLASSGQDGQVRFWNWNELTAGPVVPSGDPWGTRVSGSPDGTLLASIAGKVLRVFRTDGQLVREYERGAHTLADVAWWQSGTPRVVVATYGGLRVFRIGDEQPQFEMNWGGSSLYVACSPNGKFIATGDQDCTVHFWRPARAQIDPEDRGSQMAGFPLKVSQLTWESSSRFLATASGEEVCLWDCADPGPEQREPDQILLEGAEATTLAYQHQGVLLAMGDSSGQVSIWQPRRSSSPLASVELGSPISRLVWDPSDQHLLAGTEAGAVALLAIG